MSVPCEALIDPLIVAEALSLVPAVSVAEADWVSVEPSLSVPDWVALPAVHSSFCCQAKPSSKHVALQPPPIVAAISAAPTTTRTLKSMVPGYLGPVIAGNDRSRADAGRPRSSRAATAGLEAGSSPA
ncbi:MAG: hypothetical protein R3B09_21720 [Nannocystaceae bacterium]